MARIFKKARKPRGYKLNGHQSEDMCPHCLSRGCDPMSDNRKWSDKKSKRRMQGVCLSCGANPCVCKSTLKLPYRKSAKEITSLKNKVPYTPSPRLVFLKGLMKETKCGLQEAMLAEKACGQDHDACIKWINNK